jgi:hypothetical protein
MQADNTTLVSYQYGVLLNDGQVVHFDYSDSGVAHAAAKSMAKAVNAGVYPGQGRAVVVSRKVETTVKAWQVM